MLDVHNHILAHGQTSLLINSIIFAFSLFVPLIAVASGDKSVESEELFSSEEYDSEDYEDKAKIDIRPLRDSRKQVKPASSAESTTSFRTTTAISTTESAPVTSEELYTGTFKNVHNRKDYNYSLFTLPTVIGTLFTVNLEEWRRTQTSRAALRPVKLLDPAMKKHFTPRANQSYDKEYRRFVQWANKQYRKDRNYTRGSTPAYRGHSNWTLYPKEFENETAFQQYMLKNWVNNSHYDYRSSKWKSSNLTYKSRPWLDKMTSREFQAKPWRNKNLSELRYSRKEWTPRAYYWAVEGNETVAKGLPGRFASRRRHPLYESREGNETVRHSWRGHPLYHKYGGQNETIDFTHRRWRDQRHWADVGDEIEPMDIGAKPWRRQPYYWGLEENGTTKYSRRRGPRYWSADGNATLNGTFRRMPMMYRERHEYSKEFRETSNRSEPVYREHHEYSREFKERYNRSDSFGRGPWKEGRPPPSWIDGYEREFGPPRMREFAPPRKEWIDRRDSIEYDSRYPYDSRDFEYRPPMDDRSYSREFDDRPPPQREEVDEKLSRDADRPGRKEFDDRRSKEKDHDDREPKSKPEFDDKSEKSKELDDRRYSEDRRGFKDRPPKGRDFDDRRPRDRDRFEDRPGRGRDFGDRRPSEDREKVEDRPGKDKDLDDRRPSQRKDFDDRRPSQRKDFDDRRPSERKDFDDRRPSQRKDSDDRRPSQRKGFDDRRPSQRGRETGARSREDKYERRTEPGDSYRESNDTQFRSKFEYTGSTTEFDSNKTGFSSIRRSGQDFWDKRKRKIEATTRTTLDSFAVQAKFYRQRIEQRREKELNLLEKKRRIFWKPTDSGEATEAEETTTTTIKTTTRRSYNKMNKFFAKFSQAPNFTLEETLETPEQTIEDDVPKETSPYNEEEEYTTLYARREKDRLTLGMYNWITPAGKTTPMGTTKKPEGESKEDKGDKSQEETKAPRSGDSKPAPHFAKKKSAAASKNKGSNKGSNKGGNKGGNKGSNKKGKKN